MAGREHLSSEQTTKTNSNTTNGYCLLQRLSASLLAKCLAGQDPSSKGMQVSVTGGQGLAVGGATPSSSPTRGPTETLYWQEAQRRSHG